MTTKYVILSLLIGALAIAGIYFFQKQNTDHSEFSSTKNSNVDNIDYEIKDFTFAAYDKDGSPTQIFQGKVMRHYPIRQEYVVIQPSGKIHHESKESWLISSDRLKAKSDFNELHWLGDVSVKQKKNNNGLLELSTQKLSHHVGSERFFGDSSITVAEHGLPSESTSQQNILKADSFDINLSTGKLNLTGNINALYY